VLGGGADVTRGEWGGRGQPGEPAYYLLAVAGATGDPLAMAGGVGGKAGLRYAWAPQCGGSLRCVCFLTKPRVGEEKGW
jgi:hypothetical protein